MSEINLIPHLDEIYWRRKFVELEQDLVITQSLADKRLMLLREISEHYLTFGECLFCTMLELEEGHEHDPDCELAEAIDAA